MATAQSVNSPRLERVRYDQSVLEALRELVARRELLQTLVIRDLKVRYRRSALGFCWSMLTPLMQMTILWFVVKFAMHVSIPNLTVKILTGLLVWSFFESGLQDAADCIINGRDLVRKIYLPRAALPLATTLGNLTHFLLSLVMLLVVLAFVGDYPSPVFLFLIPLVVVQTLLIAGLGLILAAVHTFYHDIKFILMQLLRVLFFLSPVMYPAEVLRDQMAGALLPKWMLHLYMLNPAAAVIEGYRAVLMEHRLPDMVYFGPVSLLAVLLFLGGFRLYTRLAWRFAEVV